jgi:hypothetical protein
MISHPISPTSSHGHTQKGHIIVVIAILEILDITVMFLKAGGLKDISYDTIIVVVICRETYVELMKSGNGLRICSTESNPFGKVNSLCTYIHGSQREGM